MVLFYLVLHYFKVAEIKKMRDREKERKKETNGQCQYET